MRSKGKVEKGKERKGKALVAIKRKKINKNKGQKTFPEITFARFYIPSSTVPILYPSIGYLFSQTVVQLAGLI